MDAAMKDAKTQRRSSAAPAAAARSKGSHDPVYHTDAVPSARSASSTRRSSHKTENTTERPQHPSLSRVKGRSNMYTPPRLASEVSWLRDQSPVHAGTRTPPQQCKTPDIGTPTLVNPASTLLQDLLKEQRAHRISRGNLPDDWEDLGPRTPDGSRVQDDSASEKARKVSEAIATGQRQPKEMGMREMDQYVSKMNKLNFDLKLEIHHRSEQMKQLREKVQRMEEMEVELQRMHKLEEEVMELRSVEKKNQRLREENQLLSQELEKRNVAVTEAVQLICQLEAKIDELESGGRTSQMSMSRLVLDGPNVTTPKGQTTFEIPERTSSKRNSAAFTRSLQSRSAELHKLTKAPSFLRDENQSTATLRSLYAPENNVSHSAVSALTKSESFNTLDRSPESPRLSVLSECSELDPIGSSSELDGYDKLDIPVRRASSATSSLDSYIPPIARQESKNYQIDRWMGSQADASDTIIRRRQNRVLSHSVGPTFGGELYSKRSARGRPPLDALFGGARLPPTPDTMSTACAPANNGSNGSIAAQRSPQQRQDQWFAGRPVERHRSADELASRRSFNGSDSLQTNCSDTPRLGKTSPFSPTFLPYINVANKASALLGPGSPSHPSSHYLSDPFQKINNDDAVPLTMTRQETPTRPRPCSVSPEFGRSDGWDSPSPPLTPTDWVAAAKQGPRSRKERNPPRPISQAAFHDNQSTASFPTESDNSRIPTLDMNTLDVLEQDFAEMPLAECSKPEPEPEPAPETRRRMSFKPRFFHRNNNTKHVQSSPIANEFHATEDDDEDGAPSPIIPKTRAAGNARRRPVSQIIASSADTYSSSLPTAHGLDTPFEHKSLHQSLMESRSTAIAMNGAATISGRPSTSHSTETHKRRSSLGIFGWVKGMTGKRSEPATPVKAERPRAKENDPNWAAEDDLPRSATPESFSAPVVRPPSEMTMYSDDQGRRPRYVGRHSRRV
ncbi:hypothetical protein PMG11_04727 [Penicillium brasilianum]|uniref:Centrosomin N-terminal motif 1 domain-containing protein n=1 Tax=Penicillium brasilianum TaxID=104259 RepID=A0A0F7VDN0_PENBI|nr:hypothetical protein PMG11_04727 [Penicillium brasilianum]